MAISLVVPRLSPASMLDIKRQCILFSSFKKERVKNSIAVAIVTKEIVLSCDIDLRLFIWEALKLKNSLVWIRITILSVYLDTYTRTNRLLGVSFMTFTFVEISDTALPVQRRITDVPLSGEGHHTFMSSPSHSTCTFSPLLWPTWVRNLCRNFQVCQGRREVQELYKKVNKMVLPGIKSQNSSTSVADYCSIPGWTKIRYSAPESIPMLWLIYRCFLTLVWNQVYLPLSTFSTFNDPLKLEKNCIYPSSTTKHTIYTYICINHNLYRYLKYNVII